MAIAGHVSREMLEHYSHVRLEAKRRAVEALSQRHVARSYVTRHDTTGEMTQSENFQLTKDWSGREDLNLRPPGPELLKPKFQMLHLASLRDQYTIPSLPQLYLSCTENFPSQAVPAASVLLGETTWASRTSS
jgi:hypothetical protein